MTLLEKKELLDIAAAMARQIAKEEIAAAIKGVTPAPVKQPVVEKVQEPPIEKPAAKQPATEEPAAKGGKK